MNSQSVFHLPSSLGSAQYEPSVASSSALSSQASIFSEASSVQSSIASSISDDFRHNHDEARDRACAQLQLQHTTSIDNLQAASAPPKTCSLPKAWWPTGPSYADITSLPTEQRQHPRRCPLARNQKPPSLVRQDDRKVNFVESLVGKPENHCDVHLLHLLRTTTHVKTPQPRWLR